MATEHPQTFSPKPSASGWGKLPTCKPSSLASVMDEELARDLQRQEDTKGHSFSAVPGALPSPCPSPTSDHTSESAKNSPSVDSLLENDMRIAQLMQEEYDRQHDRDLRVVEKQMNGDSHVQLILGNYNRSQLSAEGLDQAQVEDEDEDDSDDMYSAGTRVIPRDCGGGSRGKRRRARSNNTTKHDPIISARKNARTAEATLDASVLVGQLADARLPTKVFNALKEHSHRTGRQGARVREKKDNSTVCHSLDAQTERIIGKMILNGTLSRLGGCISTGKEAAVFHALGEVAEASVPADGEEGEYADLPPPPMNQPLGVGPPERALKVYKTTLTDFKTREIYIRDDVRFKSRYSSQNPRKVVHMWAEKEMRNLHRMQRAGLPCPEPLLLRKHILLMSFIGHNGVPAPQLRHAKLSHSNLLIAYQQAVHLMTRLYSDCHLVHADLSEFNLLWHQGHLYVIDVSQAVEPWHAEAMTFLYRDILNMVTFFKKQGIEVSTTREVMAQVTGITVDADASDEEFIAQMQESVSISAKTLFREQVARTGDGSMPHDNESFEALYQRAERHNAQLREELVLASSEEEEEEEEVLDSGTCLDIDAI